MADDITISKRYYTRSKVVRDTRRQQNAANWDASAGKQDFTWKAEWQSRETTPSLPIALEHVVGTFERALTDSDDWLTAQASGVGTPFLDPGVIAGISRFYFDRLWKPGNHSETGWGIQAVVGDSIRRALVEPDIVLKIYPVVTKRKQYSLERVEATEDGSHRADELHSSRQLASYDVESLRLAVDVVPYEDYFPDPSPFKRYEIHRTRRQISDLLANPEYDQEAVKRLLSRAQSSDRGRSGESVSEADQAIARDPYEVEVFECWGDMVDHESGEVLHENAFWTWAGDEMIRKATPNPAFDGTRPFITSELIRTPEGREPRALADIAVPMWRAMNELVNLLLDQAMRAAWGVGQVRTDIMENPEDVAHGIPQGFTAVLKPNVAQGAKFYERVDNGEAPQLSLEELSRLEGYLQEALATPDTKLGQVPERATKATEIIQAMQSAGSLYEAFAARYEDTVLEPLFDKGWRLIVQYAESDDLIEPELTQVLGPTNTMRLYNMTPDERFVVLNSARFKVRGLRGVASRDRLFNKLMTVANLLSSNQQFADSFGQSKSYDKFWDQVLWASGVDPMTLELDEEVPAEGEEEPAPEGEVAAGQLDPTLAGSTGASQPNVQNTPQANAGLSSEFAPNNPVGNQAVA